MSFSSVCLDIIQLEMLYGIQETISDDVDFVVICTEITESMGDYEMTERGQREKRGALRTEFRGLYHVSG